MNDILKESNVTLDSKFQPLLQDLQAHILKHHGRTFSRHLFIQFTGIDIDIRRWLKTLALTSAEKQLKDADLYHASKMYDSGTLITCSMSASGYQKINMSSTNMPNNVAFTEGMKKRQSILNDNLSDWEMPFQGAIDALIIVADAYEERADKVVNQINQDIARFAKIVHNQKGRILRKKNLAIEYFGYADGISQPLYLKSEIDNQGPTDKWNDMATLDRLLVFDKGGKDNNSYGSYLVLRKLEQNMLAFKNAEKRVADMVKDVNGQINDELAGAMLIGRFEDGTETINFCEAQDHRHASDIPNNFDYKNDSLSLKCPFHAHIRMTNPRSDIGTEAAHKRRITRRGIPYNDTKIDDDYVENDLPTEGVGLLFMCYQSSIEEQFETIQIAANTGLIGNNYVGNDALIGQGVNTTLKTLPEQWGEVGKVCPINYGGFVKMLGGEYFFTPSISFFKRL